MIRLNQFFILSKKWHGETWPRQTVRISLFLYSNPDGVGGIPDNQIRVSVYGTDSQSMVRDEIIEAKNKAERLKQIEHWMEYELPNPINQEYLVTHGFIYE